ncbi:hypothetical protein [Streptomyces sp. NPDC057496]|uniref:hypothetical protein n=1 Tax=Streptomyces sp. NPDC057496 TaxID=3346149 RepID=UPI0036A0A72F
MVAKSKERRGGARPRVPVALRYEADTEASAAPTATASPGSRPPVRRTPSPPVPRTATDRSAGAAGAPGERVESARQ